MFPNELQKQLLLLFKIAASLFLLHRQFTKAQVHRPDLALLRCTSVTLHAVNSRDQHAAQHVDKDLAGAVERCGVCHFQLLALTLTLLSLSGNLSGEL